MTSAEQPGAAPSAPEVALIVGGGPGISASCARLFARQGIAVAMAARKPDKPVLQALAQSHGVRTYGCDAADAASVAALFDQVLITCWTRALREGILAIPGRAD